MKIFSLFVKGGVAGTDRQVENLKLHMPLLHKNLLSLLQYSFSVIERTKSSKDTGGQWVTMDLGL